VAEGYDWHGDDETPEHSDFHDFSEDEPDYSNMSDDELSEHASRFPDQDALRQDILSDDYKRKSFGDNFRDKYHETKNALDAAERGAAGDKKPSRDIGKQERDNKEPAWKTSLEAKRQNAISASKDKQGSFLSRHKKGVVGWLIGIVMAGSMSIFMLPSIVIAEFGQLANWIKNTTQTVHELATGARTMRNVVKSATVAARAAASTAARTHFQTSRVGMYGQMVGDNFLTQLRNSGIDVRATKVLGTLEGTYIDLDVVGGRNNGFYSEYLNDSKISTADKISTIRQDWPDLPDGITVEDGKLKLPKNMNYRDALKALRSMDSMTGSSKFKLGREIKIRYTARMLGINPWLHPVEKLKGMARDAIQEKLRTAKEKKTGKVKHTTAAEGYIADEHGNVDEGATERARSNLSETEAQARNRASGGGKTRLKVGGMLKGGAAAILLIGMCALMSAQNAYLDNMYSLTTSMSSIYQSQISTWGQIQSAFMGLDGEAIDMNVLGELHKDLYDDKIPEEYEMDEEGYITSVSKYTSKSWTESPAYQATVNGSSVSKERVPSSVATMYEEDGGWGASAKRVIDSIPVLGDLLNFVAGGLCSEIGGWIMTALGGLNPANLITTALFMEPHIAEKVGEFIAFVFQIGTGVFLDDEQLDPDQRAEVVYRASEFVINTNFASSGAGSVTSAQAYAHQIIAQEYLDAEWQSRPLADRLFDAADYRSTVAQVVNGAGINTVPSDIRGHFANFAKLVGAVPGFISGGLFGGRSAEAKAADAIAYDTGAPRIQLTPEFMDKISGGDESWDYDENAEKVFGLLGDSGGEYRKYAEDCLGLKIGDGPEFKVTAVESDGSQKALLVGFQDGMWVKAGCAELAHDENHQRVALYAGLDYSIMAGYAWYSGDDSDPEVEEIARELGFSGENSNDNNTSLDYESLRDAFDSDTHNTGDFDGAAGAQCVDISAWFLNTYTTLIPASGNGNTFVSSVVAANPGISASNNPCSPAIFSAKKCDGVWAEEYGGACYGHTGLILDVQDGDNGSKTLTAMEGWDGAFATYGTNAVKIMRVWTPSLSGDIDFLCLGDYLKK